MKTKEHNRAMPDWVPAGVRDTRELDNKPADSGNGWCYAHKNELYKIIDSSGGTIKIMHARKRGSGFEAYYGEPIAECATCEEAMAVVEMYVATQEGGEA